MSAYDHTAQPEEWVDHLDEDGHVLKAVPRSHIRRHNLYHRVTSTFVFHPDGRLFVHRRSPDKDVFPGLHDMCVGGTVSAGESWPANACREVGEELGVHGVPLYFLFEHRYRDTQANNLIHVFACVYDGPITLQPEEVVDGAWMDEAAVKALVDAGRMCPDTSRGWRLYLERFGRGRNFAREVAPRLEPFDCAAVTDDTPAE